MPDAGCRRPGNCEHHGGGGTYTRSTCNGGLSVRGEATLNAGVNDTLTGQASVAGQATLNPGATQQAFMDDPFGGLEPQPAPVGCAPQQGSYTTGSVTLNPGTYCQQLRIEGAQVTLNSGVYVFRGGVSVTGNGAQLNSNGGVLLFTTCQNTYPFDGNVPAEFYVAAQATVDVQGYESMNRIVIWVDRTAGPGIGVRLEGQAAQGFDGTMYAYGSKVRIAGGNVAEMELNMAIVADQIEIEGRGDIFIPYNLELAPTTHSMRLIE